MHRSGRREASQRHLLSGLCSHLPSKVLPKQRQRTCWVGLERGAPCGILGRKCVYVRLPVLFSSSFNAHASDPAACFPTEVAFNTATPVCLQLRARGLGRRGDAVTIARLRAVHEPMQRFSVICGNCLSNSVMFHLCFLSLTHESNG